jgi:hypothetical protein
MYPDFLCIGTPKSGTTWLDHQLRCHPALWLPPIKELHHFDCLGTAPWALYYRFDKGIQHNLRRAAKQSISVLTLGMGRFLRPQEVKLPAKLRQHIVV